ncbi:MULTISPECIES: hydroxymethylglutaryl-CoA lyase [Micromonospora]|uniref:hydroxymethylglutaryl-CoA lyase n=1 Tax=Micromonospora TaxID=1873 RepID=UPI00081FC85A|nr:MULTISPECIES: hydroxymethylglutaryl-CoA lyase [Micromonospora]MBQ1038701.1 hydroxymethylglutaryl-CoA lyase [Micromonospora sp. C81]TQJ23562.1 hydroxymethylglutaryl-CoA lyase [Micromonospora sp. A202]WTE87625.1 hydroxymethylglutaryl-CoA lyase [Micromonospora zamorensis]WTI22366.1 hydroxymethylglutaryl-CoA lyase [Micromonospora zamorensis]SCG57134.1 hydroxymethylglutaryl-CoA lyase [Micromonospora zamorensis]
MTVMVDIVEVSPRDGLQNEATLLTTADKVELTERAVRAGARRVEVTSFVNPARVPQMADADELMAALPRHDGVRYAGLVMNRRGLDRALAAGVDEINVVVVATDTFCGRNQGMTTAQACDTAAVLVQAAREAGVFTTVTVGASFGCPFEGEVPPNRLREVLARVRDVGPDELALADTIGVAVPSDVTERLTLAREITQSRTPLRLHLHDTRHTGVANAVAAVQAGVTTLDASIGGTGGCPFAPAATGNVATEDLVYLFDRMGRPTGLNLEELTSAVSWLQRRLGKQLPGALLRAGGFPA